MGIPAVNLSIQDGALGSVPASSSNVCVKMGICSGAVASVAASKLIGSTTGGDGVTFTAKTAGAQGNQISVTYTTGNSVEAPTITVSGNNITVQIKSATTLNSDVVTAIQGNATANALVSVVATVGGDLCIAVAQTYLTGGVTGNINTVISETSPSQAVTDLGYGPLTEAVCHSLNIAGGQVLCIPLNPSTAGSNTSVSSVVTGSGTLAVSGTPNDSYQFQVKITKAGNLGVAQFQWSQDGGNTFSAVFLVPAGGTFVVPNTGLTLTFGGSAFAVGDLYTFGSTAPSYTTTDVQNAITALVASGQPFGFIHLVGEAASVSASATMAATLETQMVSLASTNFIYAHAVMECANDTDANIQSAFASTVCTRVMVCAGRETVTSSIPGSGVLTRNCGFSVAAREALVPVQNDLGRVADGPLTGVVSILRNEQTTPFLDALNFTTLRTFQGLRGFFITTGHMLETAGSDFALSQNRRVMDLACSVAYPATLQFLNDTITVNKVGGTITNGNATKIENQVNGALSAAVVSPGSAVASSVVIDRTNNVLSSKTLNETVRILPFGYAKTINVNIGFNNPNVALS